MKPTLAQTIRVERRGDGPMTFTVDGEPFPWHCAPDIRPAVVRGDLPSVTVTILADRVEMVDDFRAAEPTQVVGQGGGEQS